MMLRLTLSVLAVLLCASILAAGVTQDPTFRPRVCLNGEWQFQPADNELSFPPAGDWDPVPIRIPSPWNVNSFSRGDGGDFRCFPSYPESWESVQAAWHRRTFAVPDSMRGKQVSLRFEAVHYGADVYVNGKKAGSHQGGFTPFELDVTDLVTVGGDNQLLVGVKAHQLFNVKGRATYGWGSFWGGHIHGIWQDVWLIARPKLRVSDAFVMTDVARREISLRLEIANLTASPQTARVNNHIFDADKAAPGSVPVKGLRRTHVELAPGETKTLTLTEPWASPKLWWPRDPHLYVCVTRLYPDDDDNTPLDMKRTRFGFRDFKISPDGRKFELNGVTWSGRGDAWHFMGVPQLTPAYAKAWYEMARSCNINIIRLHAQVYPEYYMDVADEMGMLIVDETSLWGSAINFWYDDDFLRRGANECRELVLRDRNHPSVALWSVANEIYARKSDDNAPSQDWIFARYAEFAQEMKKLDPTREVSSDGDNDLNGRLNIYSLHYPGAGDPRKGKICTIGEAGSMYYSTPAEVAHAVGDRAYLTFEDRMDACGIETADLIEGYRKWAAYATPFNVAWYGLEPLPIDVKFEYEDLQAPGVKPERLGPYSTMLNAGRDPNVPDFIPNPLYHAVKDAFEPIRFFVKERSPSVWAGAEVTRHLTVHNDVLEPSDLTLQWEFTCLGLQKQSGTAELSMQPGEMRQVDVSFNTRIAEAEAEEEAPAALRLVLSKGDAICYEQEIALRVVSRSCIADSISKARPLVLYDPSGKTADLLNWLTVDFRRVESADKLLEAKGATWLIGANAGLTEAQATTLMDAAGARLVVLEGNPEFYGAHGHCLRRGARYSRLFPLGTQTATEGWGADGVMARAAFGGELHGNVVPLFRCGDSEMAAFGSVDWLRDTWGIFSEATAIENGRDDPDAAALPVALVSLASSASAATTAPRPARVVAEPDSRVAASSRMLGLADPGTPAVTLICDGSRPPQNPALIRRMFTGADRRMPEGIVPLVILIGLTPEALPAWNALLPVHLSLDATDASQLIPAEVRAEDIERERFPWWLTALVADDLFWIEKENTRKIMDWAVSCDSEAALPLLVTNHTDWRRWCWKGENIKTGAIIRSEREPFEPQTGLLQVPCGKATLAVSQVRLDPMNVKSMRFYNQLLTGYSVPLERGKPTDVDLTPFNVDPDGFITAWMVCGPFDGKQPHSTDLIGDEAGARPEAGTLSGGRVWAPVRSRGPVLDLASKNLFGERTDSAAYLGTWIKADKQTAGNLWLGSDDQVKVWLNGELIHENATVRPVAPDDDKIAGVTLNEGWNFLMLKVSQGWGEWGACARLVDDQGRPLKGLIVNLTGAQIERERISREGWKATASPGGEGPGNAIDGRDETRWSSGTPMGPGMWFQLDLGRNETVSKIVLDTAGSPGDYPRAFRLEASDDGDKWRTVAQCQDAASAQQSGVLSVIIPPSTLRHLKITQTGPEGCADGLFWSIHELHLYR